MRILRPQSTANQLIVDVSYQLNLYPEADKTIDEIALKFSGERFSAGMGGEWRDLGYLFPDRFDQIRELEKQIMNVVIGSRVSTTGMMNAGSYMLNRIAEC